MQLVVEMYADFCYSLHRKKIYRVKIEKAFFENWTGSLKLYFFPELIFQKRALKRNFYGLSVSNIASF